MDFGFATGNAFIIPTPLPVITEYDLFLYLCLNLKARQEMIRKAEDTRIRSWDSVWAHHQTLWFPFLIHPSTTEDTIREQAYWRLYLLANSKNNRRL